MPYTQVWLESKADEITDKMKIPNPLGFDSLTFAYTPLSGDPDIVELTSTTKDYNEIVLQCPSTGFGIYVRSAILLQQPGPCMYDATTRLRFPCEPNVQSCTVNYRQ